MGSITAMTAGSGDRYSQEALVARGEIAKLVPKASKDAFLTKDLLEDLVAQLVGGLRSGMGYCGCATIEELQNRGASCASPPPACGRATSTTLSSPRKHPTTGLTDSQRHTDSVYSQPRIVLMWVVTIAWAGNMSLLSTGAYSGAVHSMAPGASSQHAAHPSFCRSLSRRSIS